MSVQPPVPKPSTKGGQNPQYDGPGNPEIEANGEGNKDDAADCYRSSPHPEHGASHKCQNYSDNLGRVPLFRRPVRSPDCRLLLVAKVVATSAKLAMAAYDGGAGESLLTCSFGDSGEELKIGDRAQKRLGVKRSRVQVSPARPTKLRSEGHSGNPDDR